VIIALGHVKAIVQSNSLMLFDPDEQIVKSWLYGLLSAMWSGGSKRWRADADGDCAGAPFELLVLEEALREVCEAYQRRVYLYQPLVESLLEFSGDLATAEAGLQRIVLLKDSLSDFELEVTDLMRLFKDLLSTDEDMLGLLLTAHERAQRRGEALDNSMHDEVELMLESYHRHVSLIIHEIILMQRHVQSKQEFMAISLDLYRNRMSRMNVQLGISAVSLGICTTVAGYLGMNVPIPSSVETFPHSFWSITAGSIVLAAGVHGLCSSYLAGGSTRKQTQARFEEINALQSVLRDMARLDVALKCSDNLPVLSREELKKAFAAATPNRCVSDLEVDIIFRSLDKSGDGLLQEAEFKPRKKR